MGSRGGAPVPARLWWQAPCLSVIAACRTPEGLETRYGLARRACCPPSYYFN